MPDELPAIDVLAVGHCGPDTWMLRSTVDRALGTRARFEGFDDEKALRTHLASTTTPSMLLVNRRLDGWFDAEDGITLIDDLLKSGRQPVAALLISNLPDALAAAEAVGAMPGFGKTALHAPETSEALRAAAARLAAIGDPRSSN